MIQYQHANLLDLRTDAVVLNVDCIGTLTGGHWEETRATFPEVLKYYEQTFEKGDLEPGRIIHIRRRKASPKHVFLLPSRIHPVGAIHEATIRMAVDELLEQALRLGIQSIGLLPINGTRGLSWPEIKKHFLCSFSRVPEVQLIGLLSRPPDENPVTIFTDGGANDESQTGGYGVVLRFGDHRKELSGGFMQTNHHRMELMAAVAGLETLKHPCYVRLHSDSRYLVDFVNHGSLFRLAGRGWTKTKGKHTDLWKRFLNAFIQHDVEMIWVKGHSGLEENERCDHLATQAMQRADLPIDQGFVAKANSKSDSESISIPPPNGNQSPKKPPKRKPKQEGDPCPHCSTSLRRREAKQRKRDSKSHYVWYLFCEQCRRAYYIAAGTVKSEASH